MPEYVIELDTWMRDQSRVDAWQVRLRVWRNGQYFQFFTVVVPGIDLATDVSNKDQDFQKRFWQWLAVDAVDAIKQAILANRAPLPNPDNAIELRGDVRKAVSQARSQTALPIKRSTDNREVVDSFTLPA